MNDYDVDIVFVPGQASHPFRSWRMHDPKSIRTHRFTSKCWIKEYLMPDIQEQFKNSRFRISLIGYEAKATMVLVNQLNIKDWDSIEISEDLLPQLKEIGIGKKPVIFVCFSLGGVVTKRMILKSSDLQKEVKSILFLGVPHFGSGVVSETKTFMNRAMQGYLPFFDFSSISLQATEAHDKVLSLIELSKITNELCDHQYLP